MELAGELMKLYLHRFSVQIEIAEAGEVLEGWGRSRCRRTGSR